MAQRKAWNQAMAGLGAQPPGLRQASARRSDRHRSAKHSRREKARKSVHQFDSSEDQRLYFAAARIDALEEVVDSSLPNAEDEEEFEIHEEEDGLRSEGGGTGCSNRRRRTGRVGTLGKKTQSTPTELPKRFKPRTLASCLIEDAGRADGVTKQYLEAEARPTTSGLSQYPRRKFCPVTGLFGKYTDPKTGIPYADLQALEQIRERVPPWISVGGLTTYAETVKSLRDEE